MKALKWIGTMAALGVLTAIAHPASAIICSTPSPSLPLDVIPGNQAYVDCTGRESGVVTHARAQGDFGTRRIIRVTLLQGAKATVRGFNVNGQLLGCTATDTRGVGASATCPGTGTIYIDLSAQS